MTILITGATGNIGVRVTRGLLERGERPRVFVRDADKARACFGEQVDVAVGDLSDAQSLAPALRGVDVLFLANAGHDSAARDAAAAAVAKVARVERVVKLSSLDARREGGTAVGAWHAAGEAAVRASGVSFTFVQPAGFMSNALTWAPSIKAEGVVRASTGNGRNAMIHPDDIAAVAIDSLMSRAQVGASLPLTGPEALSYAEMTAKIGAVIGRPLVFEPISDEAARERLQKSGLPKAAADALVALWRAIREGHLGMVTDTVARILGRPPLTFDRWVDDNAAAFR